MPRGTVNTIIQRYKKTRKIKKGKRTGRPQILMLLGEIYVEEST